MLLIRPVKVKLVLPFIKRNVKDEVDVANADQIKTTLCFSDG